MEQVNDTLLNQKPVDVVDKESRRACKRQRTIKSNVESEVDEVDVESEVDVVDEESLRPYKRQKTSKVESVKDSMPGTIYKMYEITNFMHCIEGSEVLSKEQKQEICFGTGIAIRDSVVKSHTAAPLMFASYSRLGPKCTEGKHRHNMVTMFYDLGNAGGHPWSERTFRLAIYGPSSLPTTNDFSTTLGNTSPLDVKTFVTNLGLRHCGLQFVDTKKNTVQWEWDNDTKIITMSTWADGMVFNDMGPHMDSNEYSLQLNESGVLVLRDILLRLSESADEVE